MRILRLTNSDDSGEDMALATVIDRGASFDSSGAFRYRLWRTWDKQLERVCFVMLNPSKADAEHDDPTIRRCLGFARDNGYGGLDVVNLFAYRTPSPRELMTCPDAVGPENERHLAAAIEDCATTVAAWGVPGSDGWHRYETLRVASLKCLGITLGGHPRHPLYVAANAAFRPWHPTTAACSPGGS